MVCINIFQRFKGYHFQNKQLLLLPLRDILIAPDIPRKKAEIVSPPVEVRELLILTWHITTLPFTERITGGNRISDFS